MDSVDSLVEMYHRHKRKITPQRLCIFKILQSNSSHPSAEDIYNQAKIQIGNISLKTVYQILNELAELNQLEIIDLGTGTIRYDPNVKISHQHLVCKKCSKVNDVDLKVNGKMIDLSDDALKNFKIDKIDIVLRGLCVDCFV